MDIVGYKRSMFLSSKEDKMGVKKPLLKLVVPYRKKMNKHFSTFSEYGNFNTEMQMQ